MPTVAEWSRRDCSPSREFWPSLPTPIAEHLLRRLQAHTPALPRVPRLAVTQNQIHRRHKSVPGSAKDDMPFPKVENLSTVSDRAARARFVHGIEGPRFRLPLRCPNPTAGIPTRYRPNRTARPDPIDTK